MSRKRRGRRSLAHKADSVSVLLVTGSIDGPLVAAINRFGDNADWGLPGGHVTPGEDPQEAAGRELVEETSIAIDPEYLRPFLTRRLRNGEIHTTYVITDPYAPVDWPEKMMSMPYEGDAMMVRPARLVVHTATNHKYNRELLRKANLL